MSAVLFYDAYNHRPLAKGAAAICGTVTANCGSFNGCGCFYVFESEMSSDVMMGEDVILSVTDLESIKSTPPLASAILARMFKGVGSHNENLVLVEFSRP